MHKETQEPHTTPLDTITTTQDYTASNSDTEDSSTQLKKGKNRQPTPLPPTNVLSLVTYSDTEYPEDTASEASINIHTQDEDSIDYNAMSPPRIYHIPMSPCKPMLTRPSYITAANNTEDQHFTADSDLPVSDTETESSYTLQTENTKLSSFQDHATYLTRPSVNTEEFYTHKHLTVSSIELHKQSTSIVEDETSSTPATNVKQPNANQ